MEIRADDRVLLLALPPAPELRAIAQRASDGIVVGLANGDALYEARRELKECANVMVTPGEPDGMLPWKDEFFTVVYAPTAAEPSEEILRVLQPGGQAWVAGGAVVKR